MRIFRPALSIGLAVVMSLPLAGSASADTSPSGLGLSKGRLLVSDPSIDHHGTFEMDPADGTFTRRVTGGLDGVYSPDGHRIAYILRRDTCMQQSGVCVYPLDLWTSASDGADANVLVKGAETEAGEYYIADPDWSPNGKQIAYDSVAGIQWVNSDGTGTVTLGLGMYPKFSPDGRHLAYLRSVEYEDPDGWETGFDVYVVDLATRESRRLTSDHQAWSTVDWSPDGSHIVYGGEYGLKSVAVATGEQTDIHDPVNWPVGGISLVTTPVYSPTGRQIAFYGLDNAAAAGHLYVIDADGSNLRVIGNSGGELTDWVEE